MLADQLDVSQSVISSLESDKSIPSAILLDNIASVLGVDVNELLSDQRIVLNNSDKAIGNIHSQETINNHFPENMLELLLSNQEKITNLIETQNKLLQSVVTK